ncbi:MAG: hypothetical protein AB1547_15350, partial [Thermodesulfobacteriota bacterium]
HMDGFEKRPQARSANPVCEAYLNVRRNDEGCSTTQHPAFLRSRQKMGFVQIAPIDLAVKL